MKERRGSRSSSVHGQGRQGGNTENGTRRLLDPGQARRSRSKSVTGRSRTRSPSPSSRLLASTHSSRAKTSDAYSGSTTLPRRSSKSAKSPNRQPPSPDSHTQISDLTHRNQNTRRSASPAGRAVPHTGDPFSSYRSFDQFRENRKDSWKQGQERKHKTSPGNLPSPTRNVSSPPRQFPSPPRNISSPPKISSYSGFESQSFSRKTSNSSSGSGSGLYSDSGFGSYSGSKSPAYSSLESSQSYGRTESSRSYQDSSRRSQNQVEQKRSSSPVKISLGALKLATINPWEDVKKGEDDIRSARNSGVFSY